VKQELDRNMASEFRESPTWAGKGSTTRPQKVTIK
jgi:hypothetical protein